MSMAPAPEVDPQFRPPMSPLSNRQKKDAVRRMKTLIETALPLLQRALTMASTATGNASVPGLSAALSALAEILKQIQLMKKTVKGVDVLCGRVTELSKIVADFCGLQRPQPMPKEMKERLEELAQKWKRIAEQAKAIGGRNRVLRLLTADSDAEKLGDLVQQINESIQQDTIRGLLNIQEYVHKTFVVAEKVLEEVFMSAYAKGAQFDAAGFDGVRGPCQAGTRVDILQEALAWIDDACLQEGPTPTHSVYWYNGLAGTGKTSIALSIAAWCREQGILGGSYFCSRFDAECSDPNSVFRTLSRQLCRHSPAFREKVIAILAQDSSIVHAAASRQFEELILRPLQELDHDHRPFPRCVVVIDALDECSDPDATSTILRIVAKYISDVAPFLVFIFTSRPEQRITHLFDGTGDGAGALKNTTTRTLLHMVKLESVSDDIRRYLEKRLGEVRELEYPTLDKAWLSSNDLTRLMELSAGLFIWAATAVRFIRDPNVLDPAGQLRELLRVQLTLQRTTQTPDTILSSLYGQIAGAAFSKIAKTLADRLQSILGTIVLAQEPLSVSTLGELTENRTGNIRITLRGLHSVLHIPDTNDEPIRIIHPTFAEYLLRPPSSVPVVSFSSAVTQQFSTSKLESFSIDAVAQHARIFLRTLDILDNLEPNIASLPTPSTFRSEVTNLASIVKERIPGSMSYSCRHWSAHLEQCNDAKRISATLDSLSKFFHERLLNWLEACSLLGALDGSMAALHAARKACQNCGETFAPLARFIFDCLRFTQSYYACIDAAPLQVHHSLLALAPIASLVKKQYARDGKQSLQITRCAPLDWGLCIDTIVGHSRERITSVSFSADGTYFATGGKDGYIRIWRTATRTSIRAIPTGGACYQVAFWPCGLHVASAPHLRIWDTETGDVVHTLEHKDAAYVAYSADGSRLASGSRAEIKLWDPLNGACLDTITSVRAGYSNGVSISPDGAVVGGDTAEHRAAICNAFSKVPEAINQDKLGFVTAFSPDGRYIASRASGIVTVWALKDKSLVRAVNTSRVALHVAFSRNSTQIGCACDDGRIRIWTIASDDPPRVLAGHADEVSALAWSPDDTQAISVGADGAIRVWDLTRDRDETTLLATPPSSRLPLPSAPYYAVLRTPKATAIFSLVPPIQPPADPSSPAEEVPGFTLHADMTGAWDAVLQGGRASGEFVACRDWAFLTGKLHANTNKSWPITMTSDGLLLAYRSGVRVVKVHNRGIGNQPILSLESDPEAFTFTSEHSHLVAVDDRTLRIWDVTLQSNDPIRKITLETRSRAIAYSRSDSLLAVGTEGGDVQVYDTTIGNSVKVLHGTRGRVWRITFSIDDQHIIAQAHPWLIIWNVETGDQVLEATSDHFLHSFAFNLDDTGILVPNGKGETTKVTLWSPGDRAWPVFAVTEDGWLHAKSPGKMRRLCWLPPEWRAVFPLGGPRFCTPDAEQKRAVIFDLSRIPEYVEAWGEER